MVSSRPLDTHIYRLRNKLGYDGRPGLAAVDHLWVWVSIGECGAG